MVVGKGKEMEQRKTAGERKSESGSDVSRRLSETAIDRRMLPGGFAGERFRSLRPRDKCVVWTLCHVFPSLPLASLHSP